MENVVIAALYHLTPLEVSEQIKQNWKDFMRAHNVTGTLLLTPEGVNGTIAGTREGIDAVLAMLKAHDAGLEDLVWKESYAEVLPFPKAKVKIKREVVPIGAPVDFCHIGEYVKPADWNALISDPNTITIDTRNFYEIQLGTFKGAIDPNTSKFKDFPAWVDAHKNLLEGKKIAMFCTGGVRCEKSTAYLKQRGYDEVYHLEGGVLKYLEEIPPEESLWQGACFVFDERVAVGHGLVPVEEARVCKGCRNGVVIPELPPQVRYVQQCPLCP